MPLKSPASLRWCAGHVCCESSNAAHCKAPRVSTAGGRAPWRVHAFLCSALLSAATQLNRVPPLRWLLIGCAASVRFASVRRVPGCNSRIYRTLFPELLVLPVVCHNLCYSAFQIGADPKRLGRLGWEQFCCNRP